MSFFEKAENMKFNDNNFTIVQGGLYYTPPAGELPTAPAKQPLTHVFKKTAVLKQDGFVPGEAVFVKNISQIIAVSDENPTVIIWDLDAEEEHLQTPIYYQPLLENKRYNASFAKISADGSKVVVGPSKGGEASVLIWNLDTKTTSESSHMKNISDASNAALSGDGSKLVTSSFYSLNLWDLKGEGVTEVAAGGGSIFPVAFSHDAKKLVSVGEGYKVIDTWDTPNAKTLEYDSTLQSDYQKVHGSIVRAVSFSPRGEFIALGFEDGKIILMDTETGDVISQPDHFKGHDYWITQIAFSGDGKWFVSCSRDGSVRVWDVESGQSISKPLKGHQSAVLYVTLSADNKRIVSVGQDNRIIVWTMQ